MSDHALPRPRWRGRLHLAAFFVSIPLGGALVAVAQGAAARVGSAIYAISLAALYGASAAFHRIPWGPRAWDRMRRVDHSMIFLLIAGTYTPFALLALRPPWSTVILAVVWTGALLGIAIRLVTVRFRALQQTLYIALGWVALFTLPWIVGVLGGLGLGLLFGGGLFYTVGAIMFMRRVPKLRPAVFGYHEVWHLMVVAGSACHFALVVLLVLPG